MSVGQEEVRKVHSWPRGAAPAVHGWVTHREVAGWGCPSVQISRSSFSSPSFFFLSALHWGS